MSDMKFKFTIQPYQTEAVESVTNVFAGQPFNDRFAYRRDIQIERDVTNWMMPDEELYMGFANERVQLDMSQLLEISAESRRAIMSSLRTPLFQTDLVPALLMWKWRQVQVKPMFIARPCLN